MFEFNIWVLVSQTINFFVLFYILNKFLFIPIGEIISNRRKDLDKIKEDTIAENNQAKRIKAEYQEKLDNVQDEIEELRKKTIAEANNKVSNIIVDAQKRAETFMEEAEMEIFMERQQAWAQIRGEVVQLATIAAERVIEESLDDEMHRKLIARAIDKLEKDLPDYTAQNG